MPVTNAPPPKPRCCSSGFLRLFRRKLLLRSRVIRFLLRRVAFASSTRPTEAQMKRLVCLRKSAMLSKSVYIRGRFYSGRYWCVKENFRPE